MALDKWGLCPVCRHNWDAGDILEHLTSIETLQAKSHEDIMKLALKYGYTELDKRRFSKLVVGIPIMMNETIQGYYKCPMCGTKFNSEGKILNDGKNKLRGSLQEETE